MYHQHDALTNKIFSVTVGAKRITSGDYAALSTSTPFVEVPAGQFRPLVGVLGGTFNDDLDLYTVNCSKDSIDHHQSGLGIQLTYDVKAQDYVAKGVCSRDP